MRYVMRPDADKYPHGKKMVPIDQAIAEGWYGAPQPKMQIMADTWIDYQSVVTGEPIQGRRQHREHLRKHNCYEIGSEKPDFMKGRKPEPAGGAPFAWEDFNG